MRNRVAWGLAAVLAVVAGGVSAAPSASRGSNVSPLRVSVKAKRWVVTLTPALQQTIAEHLPGYTLPWSEWFDPSLQPDIPGGLDRPPFACIGDFDGNGLADAVLILQKQRKQWLLVAFNQVHQGAFQAHVLHRFNAEAIKRIIEGTSLTGYGFQIEPISRKEAREDDQVVTAGDGIVFEWGDEETLFYYRRGRYLSTDVTGE